MKKLSFNIAQEVGGSCARFKGVREENIAVLSAVRVFVV